MPQDVLVEFKNGTKMLCHIPQFDMFGSKAQEDTSIGWTVYEPWRWTHPEYVFKVEGKIADLKSIEIDPTQRMADLERRNNRLEVPW